MIRATVIVAFLFSLLGCAQHHLVRESFSQDRIYPLNEFNALKEPADIFGSVAYLQPGDKIPFKVSLESDWFGIERGKVELVAKRKIYFRITLPKDISRERMQKLANLSDQELLAMNQPQIAALFNGVMLYLSKDAVNWAPINDKKALKEAFDIKGGTLTAGMGMNEAEGPWLALRVTTTTK